MLNVHQLNVFLTAAETLNFTQAAQRLQITQPSVSQHIQALEQHFDMDLFVRSGRSLGLTEAGIALIPLARRLVDLSTQVEETMASRKGEVIGHLIVGCSATPGRYLLPKLLACFHNKYPNVRATCTITPAKEALHRLLEGEFHLALISEPQSYPEIEIFKFSTETIRLIANPNHPWAQRGAVELEELECEDFILPEEGSELHDLIRQALGNRDCSIYHLKPLIFLSSPEAIALAVQENLGVGFVPELVVKNMACGKVLPVEVKGLEICQDIYLARNRQRPATGTQTAFWRFVCAQSMG
jgi:DNA-binding transcriptional LysR family regulator